MENFVVSARKYRPLTFEDVIGQENVTTTLKNAIKSKQLAQSFLFCGPRGVGKTTCARILAREVNGFEVNESGDTSGFMNIFELDAASNNSVEDIRSLIDQVRIPPQQGKYKVYIIDEVHMLSPQAFNAFLKTLEEPPPYAIFILATTEKHKIIPTILSRCQIYDFNRITTTDIVNRLKYICGKENIKADDDALHIIAQKSDGALRDSLSMLDRLVSFSENRLIYETVLNNLNILDYDYFFKMTDFLLTQDHTSALLLYDEILKKGFDGSDFISGFSEHLRNLLVCKDPRTVTLMDVSDSLKERFLQKAELCPPWLLLNALNLANICEAGYKTSNNKRLHVELTLMKMCYLQSVFQLKNQEVQPELKKNSSEQELKSDYQITPAVGIVYQKTEKVTPAVEKQETFKPNIEDPQSLNKPAGLKKNLNLGGYTETVKLSQIYAEEPVINENKTVKSEAVKSDKDIDPIGFDEAWQAYRSQLEKENRMSLSHLMSLVKPVLNKGEIILALENKLQKELFDNERGKLLDFLETKLGQKGLSFEVKIDRQNKELLNKVPFTATEKFKRMAEKNPAVLTLKEKLDLKLEH